MNAQHGLHMVTEGDGEPLVLLHGWGMHSGIWNGFTDELAKFFKVIKVDLPGHGNSARDCPLTLQETAMQLLEQLPPKAHYIGWSLGGSILMHLGGIAPERIRSMVLMTANPCFVQQEQWPMAMQADVLQEFSDALKQNYRKTLLRFIALQTVSSERSKLSLKHLRESLFSLEDPDQLALQQGLDILLQADLRQVFIDTKIPGLILLGERDQLVPVSVADFYRSANEHCIVKIIPAAGHVPFISHQSQTLTEVKGFLENV